MARPAVSVVVPFAGDERAAERLAQSLGRLELGPADEIVVADNSAAGCFREGLGVRVVRATGERSSYHARNAGASAANERERRLIPDVLSKVDARAPAAPAAPAAAAGGESRQGPANRDSVDTRTESGRWLLFMDADCVPAADLLDAYFALTPAQDVGALAGTVASDPNQRHFLARYAADRGFLDQEAGLHTAGEAAATANLAIRREAFDEIGGFTEGIRSGGDVDLCRRLTNSGWKIERRPEAVVMHLHRESLPDLMSSIARYAAGARWLNERYPDTAPAWPLVPGLVSCGKDIAGDLAGRRFEEAAFRGVDALGMFAHAIGYRRSNAAS